MIKSLFKLGLLLLVCVLGYNYFFGTEVEKEQSERIFGKVKDVGKDAWALLGTEKEKYKEGKYDGAVDKVGNTVESLGDLLGKLSRTAKDLKDSGALDRVSELQAKQKELQSQLARETPESYSAADEERVKKEIQDLLRETEDLMKDMEKE
jgi:Skp family chaperone for outer membrane proteins